MTPTELTLRELKRRGIPREKVERWNEFAKRRQDLFGIIDIIALDHSRGVVGIQATTMSNFAARIKKLTEEKNLESLQWLKTPGTFLEVWGWKKYKIKRGGKAMRYEFNIREITVVDLKEEK